MHRSGNLPHGKLVDTKMNRREKLSDKAPEAKQADGVTNLAENLGLLEHVLRAELG